MESNLKAISRLNGILKENHHAYEVYRNAASVTEDQKLQEFLNDEALRRAKFGLQITMEIRQLGGTDEFEVGVNRWRKDVNKKLRSTDEAGILKACMKVQRLEADKYNQTLEKDSLPGSIRKLVKRQRDRIERSLDEVQTLELIAEEHS